ADARTPANDGGIIGGGGMAGIKLLAAGVRGATPLPIRGPFDANVDVLSIRRFSSTKHATFMMSDTMMRQNITICATPAPKPPSRFLNGSVTRPDRALPSPSTSSGMLQKNPMTAELSQDTGSISDGNRV